MQVMGILFFLRSYTQMFSASKADTTLEGGILPQVVTAHFLKEKTKSANAARLSEHLLVANGWCQRVASSGNKSAKSLCDNGQRVKNNGTLNSDRKIRLMTVS